MFSHETPWRVGTELSGALLAARWLSEIVPGGAVLEVGATDAEVVRLLCRSGHSVTSAVPAPMAAVTLGQLVLKGTFVHVADPANLPFPAGSFGAIMLRSHICAGADAMAVVKEAERCLSEEGILLVLDDASGLIGGEQEATENLLRTTFSSVARVVGDDWVLSRFAAEKDRAETGVPALEFPEPRGTSSFVVACRRADRIPGRPSWIVDGIDVHELYAGLDRAMRDAVAAQVKAAEADQAPLVRKRLMGELFKSEQALAVVYDAKVRLEGAATLAAEQQTRLAEQQTRLAELTASVAETSAALAESDARYAELRREADGAHMAVAMLQDAVAGERVRAAEAEAAKADLERTVSWRVTRPLRMLRRLSSQG